MNLTDTIRTIQGTEKKTGITLRETMDAVLIPEEEDASRGPQLLRELRGLTNHRATLRAQVARALTERPDLVAALAEHQVATLRLKVLQEVVPRPWESRAPLPEPWTPTAFDLLFETGRFGPAPRDRIGRRTAATLRWGTPEPFARELVVRTEEARRQALVATIRLEALSAATPLAAARKNR